jgi:hypothetical protein
MNCHFTSVIRRNPTSQCKGGSGGDAPETRIAGRAWRNAGLGMLVMLGALGSVGSACSQEWTFTTLAGPGGGPGAIDGPVAVARFNQLLGVAVDVAGNVYVADSYNNTIRKITPGGGVTTLAGLAGSKGSVNGTGGAARFNFPRGGAVDSQGNVYVADSNSHTVRKVTTNGVVTTLAGLAGTPGSVNGTGSGARFNYPNGVAVDTAGNVYLADQFNSTIRKITPGGAVTTLAGLAGTTGSDDGTGSGARFNYPSGVAVDSAGNVYVADEFNQTIRKIAAGGVVTTLAGNPTILNLDGYPAGGYADGTGPDAQFNYPVGITVDRDGNVYVADSDNNLIRKITPEGMVTTLAGDPIPHYDPNGNLSPGYADGTGTNAQFHMPIALAVDGTGRLYVADSGNFTIRQVTPEGAVTTLAGQPVLVGSSDGTGYGARFDYPLGVALGNGGDLFVADSYNDTIRRVTPAGKVTTFAGLAGTLGTDDGTGVAARFYYPGAIVPDRTGNLYVADGHNHTIRKVTSEGVVTTFAGAAGVPGSDDGTGVAARFNQPRGMVLDSAGNLFVLDRDNQAIRKVTPAGEVTTFAGTVGIAGSANGTGTAAQFNYPRSLAIDRADNLYVADSDNCTIRKVTAAGVVTTLAGLAGTYGSADGSGSAARFNGPYGITSDGANTLYVADTWNNTIRKLTTSGVVTTLAGRADLDPFGGPLASSADGLGGVARFNNPNGITLDSAGNLYLTDAFDNSIRFGTTNTCPDKPTIDLASGPATQWRQLDTSPQTAAGWQWSVIRRPANSVATFSDPNIRNPTFRPDVADLYVFQLRATNTNGAICIRTLSFTATMPPPPTIVASASGKTNGQFTFMIHSLAGNLVEIQTSTNLTDWTGIGVLNMGPTGTAPYTDSAAGAPRRFYRLRQL